MLKTIKIYLIISLIISFSLLFSNSSFASNKKHNDDSSLIQSSDFVDDSVIFLSSRNEFTKAGINPHELSNYLQKIITAFNNVYQDSNDTGSIETYIEMSPMINTPDICKTDYSKCILTSYVFEDDGKIKDKNKFLTFKDSALAVPEIHIRQDYQNKLGIILYLNYPKNKKNN